MDSRLTLEKRIEAEIKSYDGKMGIYLDDFHGNVIAIHADEAFETASSIKTYILACLFDEVEKGNKSLEDIIEYKVEHAVDGSGVLAALEPGAKLRVKDAATFMIIVSDNIATNMMIDYLGLEKINQCIKALGCRIRCCTIPYTLSSMTDLGPVHREIMPVFLSGWQRGN